MSSVYLPVIKSDTWSSTFVSIWSYSFCKARETYHLRQTMSFSTKILQDKPINRIFRSDQKITVRMIFLCQRLTVYLSSFDWLVSLKKWDSFTRNLVKIIRDADDSLFHRLFRIGTICCFPKSQPNILFTGTSPKREESGRAKRSRRGIIKKERLTARQHFSFTRIPPAVSWWKSAFEGATVKNSESDISKRLYLTPPLGSI